MDAFYGRLEERIKCSRRRQDVPPAKRTRPTHRYTHSHDNH